MSNDDERYNGEFRPDQKDLALLGEVISEWSELEFWLQVILRRLARIDFQESLALFSNIRSFRPITDTLRTLADQKMDDDDAKTFKVLLGRTDKLAGRRNSIVHASWYRDRDKSEWCRYLVPSNTDKIPDVLSKNTTDQRLRARHLFGPTEMRKFCADALTLQTDITKYWDDWDHRQNFYEKQAHVSSRAQPAAVKPG